MVFLMSCLALGASSCLSDSQIEQGAGSQGRAALIKLIHADCAARTS